MKIAVAVLLSLQVLGMAACGGGQESTTSTTGTTAASTASTTGGPSTEIAPYPETAAKSFLDACTVEASKEQCQCALSYLEKNVPLAELVKVGLEAQDGKTPEVLSKAVESCV